MRYERQPIGESTFLLPKSSEMTLEDFEGTQSRNVIAFSRCRQYAGESTLSFDEAPAEDAAVKAAAETIALPGGLSVSIELLTRVQFPGNAIGDEIEGRVARAVKRKGEVLAPKGALVKGNIALLESGQDPRGRTTYSVALQWREISFDGKSGPFEGQLEEGGAIPVNESSSRGIYQRPPQMARGMQRHRDVFYVRKETLDLPRGLLLQWRTIEAGSSGAKKP